MVEGTTGLPDRRPVNESQHRDQPGASLTFYGAAGTVTGSRFLVGTNNTRLLESRGWTAVVPRHLERVRLD